MDNKLQQLADEMEACLAKVRIALNELEEGDKKWKPQNGDMYYTVTDCGEIDYCHWDEIPPHNIFRLLQNNVFKTYDEALQHLENLKTKAELRGLAEELNAGYSILWEKGCIQPKWYIYYDWNADTFKTVNDLKTPSCIYCLSHEFKDIALERIGADRLKAMIKAGV